MIERNALPDEYCDALDLDIFAVSDLFEDAYERHDRPASWIWPLQRLHERKNQELLAE